MPTRISFDNLARRPERMARASAGSVGENTPPARMVSSHLSECWRSAPYVNATWIEFEIDRIEDMDTFALIGTNLTELLTWRIRVGVDDLTIAGNCSFDSGMAGAGIVFPYGTAVRYLPAPVAGNKVRFDLEDPSLLELEVPRVWFGRSWQPTYGFRFGHEETSRDLSVTTESEYGSKFIDERPQLRGYRIEIGIMSDADRVQAKRLQRLCGQSREILFSPDDASPDLGDETMLVLRTTSQPITSVEGGFWSWSADFEERI